MSTAYVLGRYGVVPALGLALLLTGHFRLRATQRAHTDEVATLSERQQTITPASLTVVRGGRMRTTGIVLLVLGLLSAALGVRDSRRVQAHTEQVAVRAPSSLLGMARHDGYFADKLALTRRALHGSFDQTATAWYGSPYGGMLLVGGRGRTQDPHAELESTFQGISDGVHAEVTKHEDVPAATSGGVGRCEQLEAPGTALPRIVCVWIDDRSVVLTSDGEAADFVGGVERSRTVHGLVVRPSGEQTPEPDAETRHTTVALPATLHGHHKDTATIASERTAFLTQTRQFTADADIAVYKSDSGVFLVEAVAADMASRATFLRHFRASIKVDTGKDPGTPTSVSAGAPGGNGYCWRIAIDAAPTVVCALVDDDAYVAVYQLDSTDVPATLGRARQVRALVLSRH